MKIQLALITSFLILSGCVNNPADRIVTKGPLICAADEVCPELSLRWNEETRDGFKITAEINDSSAYDIKQMVFLVDDQPYVYSTIDPTKNVTNAGLITSSNAIRVPVSFLNSFKDAKKIDLKLVTDKQEILRPILKENGEKSSAYLTFLKGYTNNNTP